MRAPFLFVLAILDFKLTGARKLTLGHLASVEKAIAELNRPMVWD
jgi:hypothetical protein